MLWTQCSHQVLLHRLILIERHLIVYLCRYFFLRLLLIDPLPLVAKTLMHLALALVVDLTSSGID
jgi:hypothetical protein